LASGMVYDQPVIALDIVATSLAVAGAARSEQLPLDGKDLMPYLLGEANGAPHDSLFWRQGGNWAVRVGRWKLLRQGADSAPMLFDLTADLGESNDLVAAQPERAAALRARYDAWAEQLVEPRWKRNRANQRQRQKPKQKK